MYKTDARFYFYDSLGQKKSSHEPKQLKYCIRIDMYVVEKRQLRETHHKDRVTTDLSPTAAHEIVISASLST